MCLIKVNIIILIEKERPHSSILAQRILWTEEPGGLLSIGSYRVRHNCSDLACMHALEKEMATHSSILAWDKNPRDRGAWWAAIYEVAQSWTRLKRLSSSSKQPHQIFFFFNEQYRVSKNTGDKIKSQKQIYLLCFKQRN